MSETDKLKATNPPPPYTPVGSNVAYNPQYASQPPPGFQAYPVQSAPGPTSGYGATTVVITQPNDIIIVGGCPACRVGVLEDDYTCLGICCAIFFFPLGILCCLALKDKRCTNCNAYFG
ncbi:brain protein I3-like [Macrosteles quadrilineatus]|uniref:brain protein I3-like n=1 Tax=Macrosteles quadrilineatus TaxID=74068 RepID=UPI0023E2CA7F|nr:brain protein I3-like [Macrosteles quadrilineatus]XP_054288363.1 brain protein I3-like [Macrosteles quadrilineatus]